MDYIKEKTNFARLCLAIVGPCSQILRALLSLQVNPADLIANCGSKLRALHLSRSQKLLIDNASSNGYADFDIWLCSTLLKKVCPNLEQPTSNEWDVSTGPHKIETTEGDDIKRILFIRNTAYAHVPNSQLSNEQLKSYLDVLKDVATRMDRKLGGKFLEQIENIETCTIFDDNSVKASLKQIEEMKKRDEDYSHLWDIVPNSLEEIKEILKELSKTIDLIWIDFIKNGKNHSKENRGMSKWTSIFVLSSLVLCIGLFPLYSSMHQIRIFADKVNQGLEDMKDYAYRIKNATGTKQYCSTIKTAFLSEIKQMETIHMDKLEQKSRRNALRVAGIPEVFGEKTYGLVQKVFNDIGVPIKTGDIDRAYRTGKPQPGETRHILVKFTDYNVKRRIMKARHKLHRKESCKNIYINEDLTKRNWELFRKARKLYAEKKINKTWTWDGIVYVIDVNDTKYRIDRSVDLDQFTSSSSTFWTTSVKRQQRSDHK